MRISLYNVVWQDECAHPGQRRQGTRHQGSRSWRDSIVTSQLCRFSHRLVILPFLSLLNRFDSFSLTLTGRPSQYKTVCCRAVTDSVVIRLPDTCLVQVLRRNPEMLVRVIQLIMARLQRVAFVALHQHLGLTSELIRQDLSAGLGKKTDEDDEDDDEDDDEYAFEESFVSK